MTDAIRHERVNALVRWLERQPPAEGFTKRPGFKLLFGDLTSAELGLASDLLKKRAEDIHDETVRRLEARNG